MDSPWHDTREAFADATAWFVTVVGLVGDRWDQPGLGEWDVRGLVGHTSRSLLTVESYLARPAASVEVATPVDYYRTTGPLSTGAAVTERGREAGAALGDDPAVAVARIAARVLPLLTERDGSELVTTIVGGMALRDYLPTRLFELAVHTCDLAAALGVPAEVPDRAAVVALHLVAELAVAEGRSAPLLLAATGRTGLPAGFSVL